MGDRANGKLNDVQNPTTPITTDASHKLSTDANMGLSTKAERVVEVTALGAAESVPGAIKAVAHDLDPHNWLETSVKVSSAAILGVGMRTLLPEAGAIKAIVGTAMGLYFAKDAAMPVVHAWGSVTSDASDSAMNNASKSMGDALGSFAVDGYLTSKIAGFAGDMTPKLGEKFVPQQWAGLESWKTNNLGSISKLGEKLGVISDHVEATANKVGDKLDPPKDGPKITDLTTDQIRDAIANHERDGIARAASRHLFKNGVTGSDGMPHGLDGTYDLLMSGINPRDVPAIPEGAPSPDATISSVGQLKGFVPFDVKISPDELTGPHATPQEQTSAINLDVETTTLLAGEKDATDGSNQKTKAAAPANEAERILNAKTMTAQAAVIRAALATVSDQDGIVMDAVNHPTAAVHMGTAQRFEPLDPGYMQARNAMVSLAKQVGVDPRSLGQVYDLFNRFGNAALQAGSRALGPVQELTAQLNTYASENYTTYVRNISEKLGRADVSDVVRSKKPPLYEITSDLDQVGEKDGKPVFAHQGPHTVRGIYGPNGEPVWPIDLIKFPIREYLLRAINTSGIDGHEQAHDQYWSLGKFDPDVRERILDEAARKVLGADADKMIDLPGKGQPVLGKDGQPLNPDMPTQPAQISQKDLFKMIGQAWADETFADWGAAAESGQSAAPYFQALRKSGLLMNGTVMGEEMRSSENPLGIEAHPVDSLRPHIQAIFIRALATAGGQHEQRLLDWAGALDKYADSVSPPGDTISLASLDHVGQSVSFSKSQYLKYMEQVVQDQLHTPTPKLEGKTLFDILPDLRKNMAKNDALATAWVDAIQNGKDPTTIPFDKTTTKMTNVFAAGQPAFLRLVADGMDPMKALHKVNEFSDHFRAKFQDGDPHVDPLIPTLGTALKLAPMETLAAVPSMLTAQVGKAVRNQSKLRDWTADHASSLGAVGGSYVIQDLLDLRKKQDELLNDNKAES